MAIFLSKRQPDSFSSKTRGAIYVNSHFLGQDFTLQDGNPELYDPTSADTLPTDVIYTALEVPFIHLNFRMTYTIARSRFNTQTSTRTCR